MDILRFPSLPTWEDVHRHSDDDDAEEWKWKADLEAAEALYNGWREVFRLAAAFADALPDEEEDPMSMKRLIYESAYSVPPKIVSAAGDTLYQIKMENAALIRFHTRQMWESIGFAVLTDKGEEAHQETIEESIEAFKALFRTWVATFRRDDCDDEWGLF